MWPRAVRVLTVSIKNTISITDIMRNHNQFLERGSKKMKKTIVFLMTLIMVLSLGVTGIAAQGGFLKSPSLNPVPRLIDARSVDGDCNGTFVITPYSEKDTLDEEEKKEFEESYKDIVENPDLSDLTSEIADVAKTKNLDVEKLAVSDLFHTHVEGCSHGEGEAHGNFDIVLDADTLDKYVALMCYSDGEWSVVEDASINLDGHLKFVVEKLGSYAIVVNTDDTLVPQPPTGDEFPWIMISAVAIMAAMAVVVISFRKKEEA